MEKVTTGSLTPAAHFNSSKRKPACGWRARNQVATKRALAQFLQQGESRNAILPFAAIADGRAVEDHHVAVVDGEVVHARADDRAVDVAPAIDPEILEVELLAHDVCGGIDPFAEGGDADLGRDRSRP